jgi:hypothetical protein
MSRRVPFSRSCCFRLAIKEKYEKNSFQLFHFKREQKKMDRETKWGKEKVQQLLFLFKEIELSLESWASF